MRSATLTALTLLASGSALAHSGHGALALHAHGIELPWLLVVAVILGALITRR